MMAGLTGSQRMYGIARVLSDFYDQCEREGIPITREVQLKARAVAIEWLRSNPLLEPDVKAALAAYDARQAQAKALEQQQANRPPAANE